jgi:hypothetical protein
MAKHCRFCTQPEGRPSAVVLKDGSIIVRHPVGKMGGEVWGFVNRDTGEIHWIDCVVVANDDGVPVLVIPLGFFLPFPHAAAYLGVKASTLYSWVPYLESAEKRGSLLIFKIPVLVNDDIPQLENKLPTRSDRVADRDSRVLDGEVLRAGRHIAGCLRTHSEGQCIRPPRPNDPRRSAKQVLHTLEKKPKK